MARTKSATIAADATSGKRPRASVTKASTKGAKGIKQPQKAPKTVLAGAAAKKPKSKKTAVVANAASDDDNETVDNAVAPEEGETKERKARRCHPGTRAKIIARHLRRCETAIPIGFVRRRVVHAIEKIGGQPVRISRDAGRLLQRVIDDWAFMSATTARNLAYETSRGSRTNAPTKRTALPIHMYLGAHTPSP